MRKIDEKFCKRSGVMTLVQHEVRLNDPRLAVALPHGVGAWPQGNPTQLCLRELCFIMTVDKQIHFVFVVIRFVDNVLRGECARPVHGRHVRRSERAAH